MHIDLGRCVRRVVELILDSHTAVRVSPGFPVTHFNGLGGVVASCANVQRA